MKIAESKNEKDLTSIFFTLPNNTPFAVKRVADELKRQNEMTSFVKGFANKEGLLLWDKAIIKEEISQNIVSSTTDTTLIIPFALQNAEQINGCIKAKLNGSIILYLNRASDYIGYSFTQNINTLGKTAVQYALAMMAINKKTFGESKYEITDPLLNTAFHPAGTNGNELSLGAADVEICYNLRSNSATAHFHCITVSSGYWPELAGSNNDDGPNPPLNPGGGEAPSDPCGNRQIVNGNLPPGCGGSQTGWVVDPEIYACFYQLSTRDQEVLDEIHAEDSIANLNNQNNCKGTKRTGNMNFQGTKEHWLIQLDFATRNPLNGEVEYSIPNASIANPANRGFADMVDTYYGNIFEIKPNNQQGQQAGSVEVQNYVNKANLYCSPPVQIGTAWQKGNSYTTTIIPYGTANKFLKAELIAPGVVGYSYLISPNPAPVFVPIPQTVIDKLKELVERLRSNLPEAERIIAEYLNQHPELKVYIQTAAAGFIIGTLVGTILEDFITGGAGILDDAAAFALAYKIFRFAIKL